MSFGTGHHPTTFSMIQLMQRINFKAKTVYDFGTGTGILAILAEKLGAQKVLAVDNDDWCIENANENMLNNASKVITILKVASAMQKEQYEKFFYEIMEDLPDLPSKIFNVYFNKFFLRKNLQN
jgi:ribosomal protein L11 methyltransferase